MKLRNCGRWSKVVRKITSVEKCGGSKERTSKNKKINGISVEVGDRVTVMAGQSTQITGVVSAISKKGSVKLNQYGKWAKVVETNSDDATRDGWERDSEKKLRSRTESSSKESQRTLPSKYNKQGHGPLSHIKVLLLDCLDVVLGNVFSN